MNKSSKSILIIDTPKNCSQCCCGYDSYGEVDLCAITNKSVTKYYYGDNKPDWCPLSSLPQYIKLPEISRGDSKSLTHTVQTMYGLGYNQCLDDILKGKNE